MRTADQILEESFLDVRAQLIQLAATLDRIDRAADQGSELGELGLAKRGQLDAGVRICLSEGPDRVERLQLLFSRDYASNWRQQMKI